MKVLCVDDADIHLTSIKSMLNLISVNGNAISEIVEAKNGKLAVDSFKAMLGAKPDFVTLDIRMPEMDGLSALVLLRSLAPSLPIVMVSSEDEKTISRKKGGAADIPMNEKFALLDKVASRVKQGQFEEGKINFILDACEELSLDPIAVAEHYAASGYLKKPYTKDQTEAVLSKVLAGSGRFVQAG